MIRTPASKKCHPIQIDKPLPEDNGAVLTPARVWAAIEPAPPGSFDEDKVSHLVTIDYHPDVTLNTRILTEDDRTLWVRGVQDIEFRHIELRLLCEEVLSR
jgi:head-tail adaptor